MLSLPMQIAGWRGKCLGDSCNFDETSGLPLRMWPNKHTNSLPKYLPSCHAPYPLIKYPWLREEVLSVEVSTQREGHSCLWAVVFHWNLLYLRDFSFKSVLWNMSARRSNSKEIQPVHSKGNQSWIFIGRTDAEAETPVLWPPDAKNWLIGKDPDAGKDWRQEEKGMTEDEMVGWHHRLDGHEFG